MITRIAAAAVLTVAVESPVVALMFRSEWRKMALTCALTTAATNLAMNVFLLTAARSYSLGLLMWEAAALVVEAAVYAIVSRQHDVARAVAASGLANALSLVVARIVL